MLQQKTSKIEIISEGDTGRWGWEKTVPTYMDVQTYDNLITEKNIVDITDLPLWKNIRRMLYLMSRNQ